MQQMEPSRWREVHILHSGEILTMAILTIASHLITLTFVRGGGEVVFKNTYESLSVDGRCVPITERTSLT